MDEAGAWRSGGLRLDLPHFPRGAHEIGGAAAAVTMMTLLMMIVSEGEYILI